MANSKQHRYTDSFKHEVCQYYTHHTGVETQAKYNVDPRSICRWRVALGYNNKYRSYNLYTQTMQPALKKSQQREWMVLKRDNELLLSQLGKTRSMLVSKDSDNLWLKQKLIDIADAIKTMED